MNNLTQKEQDLLKDLKDQEQLCIDKYTKHTGAACDPQLKNLFSQLAQVERQHYNTIEQIEQGQTPSQQGGGQQGGNSQSKPTFSEAYSMADAQDQQNQCFKTDSYLCTDLLTGEKSVSHLYDTCIFEFKDENIRNTLNHIQKEEQEHGKMIYDYMTANNMYS